MVHRRWDYQQSYCSPFTGINTTNVRNLGFAWDYAIDAMAPFYATPIIVDGVMFTIWRGGQDAGSFDH